MKYSSADLHSCYHEVSLKTALKGERQTKGKSSGRSSGKGRQVQTKNDREVGE